MKPDVGSRVFAIMDANAEEVRLFGFGVYAGDEVPDENAGGLAAMARSVFRANPMIVLDSGKVVWGGECWWGPEARWSEIAKDREVVQVDIDAVRREYAAAGWEKP